MFTHPRSCLGTFKTDRDHHPEVDSFRVRVDVKVEKTCRIAVKLHLQCDNVRQFQKFYLPTTFFFISYLSYGLIHDLDAVDQLDQSALFCPPTLFPKSV